MRQIEPIAAYLPYMTSVGNHEEKYNFSHYKARFSMPGNENGLMYSFNLGPAHIISISTEFYYFINYGFKQIALQYDWLTRDLEEANAPENRTVRPWIIIMGHRPMYCSNTDQDDCTKKDTLTRVGLSLFHWYRRNHPRIISGQRMIKHNIYHLGSPWSHSFTNMEWTWPCGLMSIHTSDCGLYITVR